MAQWVKNPKLGHCCGVGSVPLALNLLHATGMAKKKTTKKPKKKKTNIKPSSKSCETIVNDKNIQII